MAVFGTLSTGYAMSYSGAFSIVQNTQDAIPGELAALGSVGPGGGAVELGNGSPVVIVGLLLMGMTSFDGFSDSALAIVPYRWGLKRAIVSTFLKIPGTERRSAVPFAAKMRDRRLATRRMDLATFTRLVRERIATGKNTQEPWQAELRAARKAGTLEPDRIEKATAARKVSPKRARAREKVAAALEKRAAGRPVTAKRARAREKVAAALEKRAAARPVTAKRARAREKVAADLEKRATRGGRAVVGAGFRARFPVAERAATPSSSSSSSPRARARSRAKAKAKKAKP